MSGEAAEALSKADLEAIERRAWSYRDSFAGVVQGACADCGYCDEDNCACDRLVSELIGRIVLIDEEAAALRKARGEAS